MKRLILLVFLTAVCGQVFALTPEQQGLQIVQEVDRRDTGFGDSQSDLKMVLRNRSGDESVRVLNMKTLEMDGGGDARLSHKN